MNAMAPKTKAKKARVAGVQAIQKPPKSGWVQEKPASSCALPTLPQPACACASAADGRTVAARARRRAHHTRPRAKPLAM